MNEVRLAFRLLERSRTSDPNRRSATRSNCLEITYSFFSVVKLSGFACYNSRFAVNCPLSIVNSDLSIYIDFVSRPAAKNLRFPPTRHLVEGFTFNKCLKILLAFPIAQDQKTPLARDVFIKMRFLMTLDGFEVFDDIEKSRSEFFFLAGDYVVVHADGGHWLLSYQRSSVALKTGPSVQARR